MKSGAINKSVIFVLLIYFVYTLVNSFCLILSADDFLWTAFSSVKDMIVRDNQNGRFFTNSITYLMVNSPFLRIVLYVMLMMMAFVSYAIVIDSGRKHLFFSLFITFVGIVTLYSDIANSALRWISGFTNYVVSSALSCIFIFLSLPLFNGKTVRNDPARIIAGFVLGFFGALCLENISIYNLFIGLFFFIIAYRMNKKFDFFCLLYFIGTLIGIIIMFSHPSYHSIFANGEDLVGIRSLDTSPIDIIYKVYREIIPSFAKKFLFVHVLISSSIILLYRNKYSLTGIKPPKYMMLCISIILSFAVYSLFTVVSVNLVSLTGAFRTASLEVAFTALYFFSLIYVLYHLSVKAVFFRSMFFLFSILFVTAPYLIVNPVSNRCFYNVFVFWLIFAGDIAVSAFETIELKGDMNFYRCIAFVPVLSFSIVSSYVLLSNKYIEHNRISYLHSQLDAGSSSVYFLELPYPTYCPDTLIHFISGSPDEYYYGLICNYYDFDPSLSEKKFIDISTVDYFQLAE